MVFFGLSYFLCRSYRPRPWVMPTWVHPEGLVGDASEARRLHERFDQQGRDVIAHGPVLDQLSAHDGQDVRGEVGDAYPGQDEETGVVDDLGEIFLPQCRRPSR